MTNLAKIVWPVVLGLFFQWNADCKARRIKPILLNCTFTRKRFLFGIYPSLYMYWFFGRKSLRGAIMIWKFKFYFYFVGNGGRKNNVNR
jgi:hypothetical protein